MDEVRRIMKNLAGSQEIEDQERAIPFDEFLVLMRRHPARTIRNIHQIFHDMVKTFVGEGVDEYPGDPESINFIGFDFTPLLVDGSDQPFFADRLFANRLMSMIDGLRGGAQQNKIYLFDGPPGCGKSTFLNNLLRKFEEYANSPAGTRYEVVWHLDRSLVEGGRSEEGGSRLGRLLERHGESGDADDMQDRQRFLEVPCPSHDNPLLLIPRKRRPEFLDDLFEDDQFKWNLSTSKDYDWVFRDNPCTICSSLYQALLHRVGDAGRVMSMIHARPYRFDRRLGKGITVFNPGDRLTKQPVLTNAVLQRRIGTLLQDSNQVRYLFSRYARTNNGIYALMDIKGFNRERLLELHNIISDGVHKVEEIEERVYSLFMGVMNPEDNKNIRGFQSLSDRIEFINISYVLDSSTEVEIYRNIFGRHIGESFLPRVLNNFARVIISSRLNEKSPALLDWIGDAEKYKLYCDENLHLLKMAIYTGIIPVWLDEEDRKNFTARIRRRVIAEAETEGQSGFSGRDSIDIFHDLYANSGREGRMITMDTLCAFFTRARPELARQIPDGFLESLRRQYNYQILQEVKESLYYYNEERIARDLKNYLFALNYETGTTAVCSYTGDKLEITESFLAGIENHLLGEDVSENRRQEFRAETQREYTSRTLTQEIMVEGLDISMTKLFGDLHKRYVFSLKNRVLDPFLGNANFRRAVKDFATDNFRTYDRKIRDDVTFLLDNLQDKFGYNEQGAREVCLYVVDNELTEKFRD
ncbi:serine protein kinase [bacterium CG17_big_fil_post_rev_8_21_14_2_50_64_8]|nr:MAG: serine protein kinase [bacterium CG17_big_fil_post_rev_8_21_14_2_50_64_8]PJA74439.1 MAG: serine protein kinase [bacterium CG_4_9_14_3_um_filter_65_15]